MSLSKALNLGWVLVGGWDFGVSSIIFLECFNIGSHSFFFEDKQLSYLPSSAGVVMTMSL